MRENYTIPDQINFIEHTKMSYHKFYKDLDDAISKRDKSNIYKLSKVITRYHLSR